MSSCGYTAGELNTVLFLKEDAYGITPTIPDDETGEVFSGQFIRGPETVTLQRTDDIRQYQQYLPGNRSFDAYGAVSQGYDAGLSLSSNARTVGNWIEPLLVGALGGSGGTDPLDGLPSYSMLIGVGTVYKDNLVQHLYNGCKVDSLTFGAEEAKGVIQFSADVMARGVEKIMDGGVSRLQEFTLDDSAPIQGLPLVQWEYGFRLEDVDIYPDSWTCSVSNNLRRKRGKMTGADSHPHDVTTCIMEGQRSMQISATLPFSDYSILEAQTENRFIDALEVDVGEYTIRYLKGRYEPNSLPELSQDISDVTVTMNFMEVQIT